MPDAGEEGDGDDGVVELQVWFEGCLARGQDEGEVVVDVDAGRGQWGEVVGGKGVELFGTGLGDAVAAVEVLTEADGDLGHHGTAVGMGGGGVLDGVDEVLLAVGAQDADGQLAAGEYDGTVQAAEHEAEGGGGVGHRVGAVEYDVAVCQVAVVDDDTGQLCPEFGRHVGGVDGGLELVGQNLVVELVEFGHVVAQVLEVEGAQGARLGMAYHTDGATGVDDEDAGFVGFHVTKIQINCETFALFSEILRKFAL